MKPMQTVLHQPRWPQELHSWLKAHQLGATAPQLEPVPLLATGVRRVCAPPEQDRLVNWLKTGLLNHLACQLIWLAVHLAQGIYHQALLSPFCSVTAAALASVQLICVRAQWAAGHAGPEITAVLYGHNTTAASSLQLQLLSFQPLFSPCISCFKYSAYLAVLCCLGRWLSQIQRWLFLIWININICKILININIKARYK